jgi:hypothetical protein
LSSKSRIASTWVLLAASTSIKSTKRPLSISTHAVQTPHGLAVIPVSQLSDLAGCGREWFCLRRVYQ